MIDSDAADRTACVCLSTVLANFSKSSALNPRLHAARAVRCHHVRVLTSVRINDGARCMDAGPAVSRTGLLTRITGSRRADLNLNASVDNVRSLQMVRWALRGVGALASPPARPYGASWSGAWAASGLSGWAGSALRAARGPRPPRAELRKGSNQGRHAANCDMSTALFRRRSLR